MTKDHTQWWTGAARSLSRAGLLWLALAAVTLGSLVSSGTGLLPIARLVAASNVGTGKLKANGPDAPAIVRGVLAHRALEPDTKAKRQTGGTPLGLVVADRGFSAPSSGYMPLLRADTHRPAVTQGAFSARAPPA